LDFNSSVCSSMNEIIGVPDEKKTQVPGLGAGMVPRHSAE
jgi:hypothetical protein